MPKLRADKSARAFSLGNFRIVDVDYSANVTFELNSRFFELSRVYFNSVKMSNVGEISWGLHSSLERERKIRRRWFTSSIKREIRHFYVEFEQQRPRIVQKSVLHVQSCFLLNQPIAFLLFECFHSRGQHLCNSLEQKRVFA